MKRSKQVLSSITLIVFLTACIALSPNATDEVTPIRETAVAAASTSIVQTMTAFPTSTVVPIDTAPTTLSTPRPTATPLPDFEPTQIPGLLQSALTIETLSSFNGHSMQRISGWKHGFYNVEWLDANHLMMYPFAGLTGVADATIAGTYPAVANLSSKKFWIPYLSHGIVNERASLSWSTQLGVLIIPGPNNNEVSIYSPDGDLMSTYPGSLLGVSPSATKILIGEGTWLDLSNGKTVNFAWHQTYPATDFAIYAYSHQSRPIWSPDEMRVYSCCYVYGDARTGTSLVMPYDGITIDGKETNGVFEVLSGTWVLNNKYMMPIWQGYWDSRFSAIFLFDPAAKTYRNLSKRAGLPDYVGDGPEPYCNRPSAQSGGRYVWVDCVDGGHLIDLVTFTSRTYPPFDRPYGEGTFSMPDAYWAADGNSIWFDQQGKESVLSGASGEMKLLPENCAGFEWHPKDNVLLSGCDYGQSLLFLDGRTFSILKQATLPNRFVKKGWSPDGKHIALLADDNSLWQIDYPNLENLEQLTPAMPKLTRPIRNSDRGESLIHNVVWASDGSAIAFIGAQDIYVVHMNSKP
jgi:hypothetical protein